ncbi:ABC transporter substrate-binding protein [Streptomyces sp. NPDC020917]|uniref:ABC transporter substrate-binding protein n=1 Tax=Streptomyces sp. NPDC020917 TaxID=3365102 RepID=UPI0037AE056A
MKRHLTTALRLTAATVVAVLAAAGCGAGTGGGSVDPGSVKAEDTGATLKLWVRPGNESVTDAVVKAYNSSHKNQVEITHVPADQYMTKFAAAAQSGSLPDILATDVVYMPQVVRTGAVLDLTSLLAADGAAGHLSPAHTEASTEGGKVYGVPYVADTSLYLYNKTLFKQAGLDPDKPPTTWKGLIAAADAITALGHGNKGFYISGDAPSTLAYDFTPLIWAQRGNVVSSSESFQFDNAPTRNALTFLQTLYRHGDIPETAKTDTGDGFFSVFASGRIGIDFAGGNGVNTAAIDAKSKGFTFGLAPIPGPDSGQIGTFSGGDVASIAASSKHVDQAWDFIDWLVSKQTQQDVYLKLPALPVRTDVQVPGSLGEQFAVPASLVPHGRVVASPAYNNVVADPQGPWLTMIRSVVFNGADPAAATRKAQAAADAASRN